MRYIVLAAAMLILPVTVPAAAEDGWIGGCDLYAAEAVADAIQARQLGCMGMISTVTLVLDGLPVSFTGPSWSTDAPEHASWCRAHPNELSTAFSRRKTSMIMCMSCNRDATRASQQTQAAADLKCGFTGPQWDNNSFATQMQACFKGGWTGGFIVSVSDMAYQNNARDKELAVCKQEKSTQAKFPVGNSQYTKRPYLERHIGSAKANTINEVAADKPCKWCKSTTPIAPQRGGTSAMDRLGDLNNNLGSVAGNSGGAQIGRAATPRPTSPTAPSRTDAVVRAPPLSNTGNGGFKSKPISSPTFNDPNPVR